MDRKVINYSEIENLFLPNTQRSFATVSPVSNISGPFGFYTLQGNPTYTSFPSVVHGTVYGCRVGEGTMPFKFYGWTFNSTGTASLVRLEEIDKKEIEFHWTDKLPSQIKAEAPRGIVEWSEKVLESFPNYESNLPK